MISVSPRLLVILSALCGAIGQVLLKLGANGATQWWSFINTRLLGGLAFYALSTVLWILALSRWPLTRVYPFTALTFVLVYVASAVLLKEPVSLTVAFGAGLVLLGLVVITTQ